MKQSICLLPLLCLFLNANAQQKATIKNTADTVSNGGQAAELHTGDPVPDINISDIANLTLNGKSMTTARISDFKGQLLIIDFWATWCAPCRAMIPRMDSLQKQFKGRIQFLPVSYENKKIVEPLLAQIRKQHDFDLPEVTGDTALNHLFPHRSLPHYVWIDSKGKLRAITEYNEVTALNIRRMLIATGTTLASKQDIRVPYDNQRPLLIGGNGGQGTGLIYHSLLTHYQEGIGGGLNISVPDSNGQRFTIRNASLIWLARLAYADHARWFPNSRIVVDTKDSLNMNTKLTGQAYAAWLKSGKGWCYELQVPPALVPQAFSIIRTDLARFFPAYRIGIEKREVPSLVLVRTSTTDHLKSAGGASSVMVSPYACHIHNGSLSALMMRLERQYMQNSKLPIADGTGYTGAVDIDFEAPLSDLQALNKALAPYDLAFVEKLYPAELLVIGDQIKPQP
jgi:thiol-disulfide isomerase/thioredoxin